MTWRTAAGLLFLAHGLAHTLPGMRAGAEFSIVPALAWALALAGFLGAGCGLLGARAFAPRWDRWAAAGILGSAMLLIGAWPTPLGYVGLLGTSWRSRSSPTAASGSPTRPITRTADFAGR